MLNSCRIAILFLLGGLVVTPEHGYAALVAYWPLDEGSGTTSRDQTASQIIGTLGSGASWTSLGRIGAAVRFSNSTNSRIDYGAPGVLKFGTGIHGVVASEPQITHGLTLSGTGEGKIDGPIDLGSAALSPGQLIKEGTGTWILAAQATVSALVVRQGSLALVGGDDRLPMDLVVTLGDGARSGELILGDLSGPVRQRLAGLVTSGDAPGNRVVGGSSIPSTVSLGIPEAVSIEYAGSLGGQGPLENNLCLVKEGLGELILAGVNSYQGGTSVTAGTLVIASAAGLPSGGSLTIGNSAIVILGGGIDMTSVTAHGASPVPEPGSLALLLALEMGGLANRMRRAGGWSQSRDREAR